MKQSALPMEGLPPLVLLADRHYLGPRKARITYEDRFGVMLFDAPTARRIPTGWLELVRWCVTGEETNAGSQQWKAAKVSLLARSEATTVVSYSDPSVGHTGALYRACNWLWAPTWLRLFPPPSGNGSWSGKVESVKDRWIVILRPDVLREQALRVHDPRIQRIPWAEYREPKWKRGTPILSTGGGDYKRFVGRYGLTAQGQAIAAKGGV